MAYKYKGRETFGQKAKRFMIRTTIKAAFAAAVVGTGWNYYGTRQDVDATVTSVETSPAKTPGKAPEVVIHTDHGTFANDPTYFYFKSNGDAIALNSILQPGSHIKMTAYGFRPHIGKYGLDDLHIYRNISDAKLVSGTPAPQQAAPASPAQPTAATPHAPQPVVPPPPANQVANPSAIASLDAGAVDMTSPQSCGVTSDPASLAKYVPQVARDLALLAKLPLTGNGIAAMVEDPNNRIQSCLFPVPEGYTAPSHYQNKEVDVVRGEPSTTTFHEEFHATQEIREGQNTMYKLTEPDAAAANLLKEASAVAFEMATTREAQNHGIALAVRHDVTKKVGNETVTYSEAGSSDFAANWGVFNAAYDKAWQQNASADAQTREAKSLEAGGKAVVRRLIAGDDSFWHNAYSTLIVNNINQNLQVFGRNKDSAPGYDALRSAVFSAQGHVSDKINFTPDEFLGPDARNVVRKCVADFGFTFTSASNTPPKGQNQLALARKAGPAFG